MIIDIRWENLDSELKSGLEEAINKLVTSLIENQKLNLTSLKEIVLCENFKNDVTSFQKLHGLRIGYTDTQLGVAGAKTLSYIQENEYSVSIFLSPQLKTIFSVDTQYFFHILHHELCHVHEGHISYNLYGDDIEQCFDKWADKIRFAHAELIWSEYVATRLSVPTINEDNNLYAASLLEAIVEVKKNCGKSFDTFDEEFSNLQLETSYLLKICSYFLGYCHGLKTDISSYMEDVFEKQEYNYFKTIFYKLNDELERLYSIYPDWESVEELRGLSKIVHELWRIIEK